MVDEERRDEAGLVAELSDLLRLDHDAVQAYTLALQGLPLDTYHETLSRFRGDHERHVAEVLRRAAHDEERHYAWAEEMLERLGAGTGTLAGLAVEAFERVHGRTADLVESAERRVMDAAERLRRGVT